MAEPDASAAALLEGPRTTSAPGHSAKYAKAAQVVTLPLLVNEVLFFESAAMEVSTRKQIQSTVNCYSTFCGAYGLVAFPLSFKGVAPYITYYCYHLKNTTRSIPTRLSHLRRANRERGYIDMTPFDEARLKDVQQGLRKYDDTPVARKCPITLAVLRQLQQVINPKSLHDLQTMTMARLAHACLLRGSELTHLEVGHVQWAEDNNTATVVIHKSKANKVGPPEYITILNHGPTSAAAVLRQYWDYMGFDRRAPASPLWPQIPASGAIHWSIKTTKASFVASIRRLLQQAGLTPHLFSGHSFRSGGATDLWESRHCRANAIKLFGRWRTDVFYIYIRDNPQGRSTEVAQAFAAMECITPLPALGG